MVKVPDINDKNQLAAGSSPHEGADGLEAAVTSVGNDNEPDVTDAEPETFMHWYSLAFSTYDPRNGPMQVNIYMGYDEMKLTARRLATAASHAFPNVNPASCVMLDASYLGFMTKAEFEA